jgi:pimeloyl-ACP methyl ester carboxylesterase
VSNRIISTGGADIRIVESGTGEPALVFLHYWGGSSRTWRRVIDRIGDRPRCIALDQRGWGGSIVTDGRYDLGAVADDVEAVARAIGLRRCVLVGHSMGGKVAQIVATTRRPEGVAGLVLVAPAPPTPMPVPEAQRSSMLNSYGSREGVLQALSVLAGGPLATELREQVIEDTLAGAPWAKQAWTERGMIEDVSGRLAGVIVPVIVVVGDRDQERAAMSSIAVVAAAGRGTRPASICSMASAWMCTDGVSGSDGVRTTPSTLPGSDSAPTPRAACASAGAEPTAPGVCHRSSNGNGPRLTMGAPYKVLSASGSSTKPRTTGMRSIALASRFSPSGRCSARAVISARPVTAPSWRASAAASDHPPAQTAHRRRPQPAAGPQSSR